MPLFSNTLKKTCFKAIFRTETGPADTTHDLYPISQLKVLLDKLMLKKYGKTAVPRLVDDMKLIRFSINPFVFMADQLTTLISNKPIYGCYNDVFYYIGLEDDSSSTQLSPVIIELAPKLIHLDQMKSFFAELEADKPSPASSNVMDSIRFMTRMSLRYLVDQGGNLWFAPEGTPSASKPPHYKMTGDDREHARCLTAGNLDLSLDLQQLLLVNHVSGDFRPDFDSLKWLLAILIANKSDLPFHIPESILLQTVNASGMIDVPMPLNWLPVEEEVRTIFAQYNMLETLMKQPAAISTVTHKDKRPGVSKRIAREFDCWILDETKRLCEGLIQENETDSRFSEALILPHECKLKPCSFFIHPESSSRKPMSSRALAPPPPPPSDDANCKP